jgi:hypothetical protein
VDDPFTPEDVAKLSAEIDAELRELGAPGTGLLRGRTAKEALGGKQKKAIEKATGEDATSFLARFKNAARRISARRMASCTPNGPSGRISRIRTS